MFDARRLLLLREKKNTEQGFVDRECYPDPFRTVSFLTECLQDSVPEQEQEQERGLWLYFTVQLRGSTAAAAVQLHRLLSLSFAKELPGHGLVLHVYVFFSLK